MKKILCLVLIFIVIPTLFLCAKMSDDVQDSIKLIQDAQNQVEEVRKIIQGTADQLARELIGGINEKIKSYIDPSIKTIEDSRQQVENIPNVVLTVIQIGDLKKTLAEIKGLVNKVKGFLQKDVEAVFQEYVNAFDKAKDSKRIHGLLGDSATKFVEAKANLVELRGYLVDLGM